MKVAAVQMASGPNVNYNLIEAGRLIALAVEDGAELVVLPENFALMGMTEQDKLKISEAPGAGRIQDFLAEQSLRHGIWLVGGTIPLNASVPNKVRATCLLFNDRGQQVARYDKLHLFDVDLAGGERYRESERIAPGDRAVVAPTPWGLLGMTICYDVRFPRLYRALAKAGAAMFTVPAAFTEQTGRAHWHILNRARAIECGAFVIAAAQCGTHAQGRRTFGHSLIIDPWGEVLAEGGESEGVIVAEIDLAKSAEARRRVPSLQHDRAFAGPDAFASGTKDAAE